MYTEKKDKVAAVFSYLSWIFWVVAFIIRNRDDELSRFHLNQGFILAITGSISAVLSRFHGILSIAGDILGVGVLVLSIMGIVRALKGSSEPLPIIGDIHLL